MPCNTIETAAINLELRADNKELLRAALESLGYFVSERDGVVNFKGHGVEGKFVNGQLKVEGYESSVSRFDVNEVKRAYSEQTVMASAKRFGWEVKKTADNKFKIKRRA